MRREIVVMFYGKINNQIIEGPIYYFTHSAYLSFSGVASGVYSLGVMGHNPNPKYVQSYTGSIVISPVPEPKTYAMMLLGLGLIGFSAPHRMNALKSGLAA